MCGIVGYISPWSNGFATDEINVFRDMLVVDSLRGFDSTGVFGVSNTGNVEIMKDAITGAEFVSKLDFMEFASEALKKGQFVVGHNRYATKGMVNATNAHPFDVDSKIVLVHNGTMREDHKQHANVEVDSHAIAHLLAKNDNIEEVLSSIDAAYALVWYNTETKTLHMVRNEERPLYIADVMDGGVIFASEAEFILMAAARNTQKLKSAPTLLPMGTLHSYQLDEKDTWIFSEKKLNIVKNYKNKYPFLPGIYGDANNNAKVSPGKGKNEVIYTFPHYCFNKKLVEYQFPLEDAKALMQNCDLSISTGHHIQLIDYLPVNDDLNCSAWYIYGQLISADAESPKILYYTKLENKTEEEIIAMVTKQEFYTVNASSVSVMHVDRHDKALAAICAVVFTNEIPLMIISGVEQ